VPIFASTAQAVRDTGGDVAVMFIPPATARKAAVSAIEAGIKHLVVLTEHIPAQDVMALHAAAARHGTRIVGPNTAGLVTPGECFVGIMPAFVPSVFKPGHVGVISRSGSLGTLVCLELTQSGLGQSAFIGIGGDRCSAPPRATRSRRLTTTRNRGRRHRRRNWRHDGRRRRRLRQDDAQTVAAFIAGAASLPARRWATPAPS